MTHLGTIPLLGTRHGERSSQSKFWLVLGRYKVVFSPYKSFGTNLCVPPFFSTFISGGNHAFNLQMRSRPFRPISQHCTTGAGRSAPSDGRLTVGDAAAHPAASRTRERVLATRTGCARCGEPAHVVFANISSPLRREMEASSARAFGAW